MGDKGVRVLGYGVDKGVGVLGYTGVMSIISINPYIGVRGVSKGKSRTAENMVLIPVWGIELFCGCPNPPGTTYVKN